MSITQQAPFQLERIGVVMEPDLSNPHEVWGVLNPASARSRDGELYLFPRLVAEGNYSRIGIARVLFDDNGVPVGTQRVGVALEPEMPYERSERSLGGVEDPRVTFVEPLGLWVMAYVGVSAVGPRIALAVSDDLFHWERLGLLEYELTCNVDFAQYGNKDGTFFPDVVTDPYGAPALALIHRPTYLVHRPDGTVLLQVPCGVDEERESIWIGYIRLEDVQMDIHNLVRVYGSRLLASPVEPWESLKLGGGTPPVRIPEGWLTFYHGVSGHVSLDPTVPKHVYYAAGAMVLDAQDPTTILYRSARPVLEPEHTEELEGIVPNVVFPTAVDLRPDNRLDVYYGMADDKIGVAWTGIPEMPPESGVS